MQRKIPGPKRGEVTEDWMKLHNEELHDLCCSPDIVRVIKWRRMGLAGHAARMEEEKRFGNIKTRDHLEDQGADGRILTIITIITIIIMDLIGTQARVWSG